jgi:hypothetical protein
MIDCTLAPRPQAPARSPVPALQAPDVHVELTGEQHSLAPHVHRLAGRGRRMPDLACELAVCSARESCSLIFVLADEHDVGPIAVRDREIRSAQQDQVRRAGATEVLKLSSARRDRNAKPFPLWGD